MADDAKLIALVEANTKQFENALKRLEGVTAASSRRISSSMKSVDATFAGLGRTVSGISGALGKLGIGAALGLSVQGLVSSFTAAAKKAGDLLDAANKIGIGTKSLQELRFAAGQSGVDIGELDGALTKFSKNLAEARNGTGKLADLFKRNGVSMRDAKGDLLSFDEALSKVSDLMKNAANAQDRLAIAQLAFGKGGLNLVNLFGEGAASIDQMREAAEKLGVVMGDDLVREGAKFDDKLQELEARFGTFADTALLKTLQVLEAIGRIEHGVVDAITTAFTDSTVTSDTGLAAQERIAVLQKRAAQLQKIIDDFKVNPRDKVTQDTAVVQLDKVNEDLTKAEEDRRSQLESLKDSSQSFGEAAVEVNEAATKLAGAASATAAAMKTAATATSDSASLIAKREGFKAQAYYDVNHYRVGYGSDTMTDPSGTVSETTASSTTTVAAATRDLVRRIKDIQAKIMQDIGDEAYKALSSGAVAALTSVAYNYGSLPPDILAAAKTSNATSIADAIGSHAGDNAGINRQRRLEEQQVALTGVVGAEGGVAELKAQSDAMDDANKATLDLAAAKKELITSAQQEIESLGLEAKSFGLATYEAERQKELQSLLNQSTAAGIPITEEYRAQLEQLAAAHASGVVAVNEAQTAQDGFNQATADTTAKMDEFRSFSSGVLSGFISDLVHGKSAAEALGDALSKIGDKLIDMASNSIIESIFGKQGTSGIGGIFGSLFGGGATAGLSAGALSYASTGVGLFHQGGVVGAGGPSRAVPAGIFAGAPRFHTGGVPGLQNGELPAILKRGELVLPGIPKLGPMARGGGDRSRMDVHNRISVEPSPLFVVSVKDQVDQGKRETLAAMPGYLADRKRRSPGGRPGA